ncbi:MAG: type II toxin-antitoxin system VapC family toxin [Thermoleophilaceae bacterium]
MITLDTSAIVALANRDDPDHGRTVAALESDSGPYLVPCEIMAEVAYLIERRLGGHVLDAFLTTLESGELKADHDADRMSRVRELAGRYADLPLGFADAAVVACAENHGGRVLTLDERDFCVVAREGRLEVLPGPS